VLQHAHALDMPAQLLAGLGRHAGLAAHQQRAAGALLQLPYALRHRGRRDVQRARGAFEAAFAHHGGEGVQGGVVEHGVRLKR